MKKAFNNISPLTGLNDNLRIHVHAPDDKKGINGAISFGRDRIDYLYEINEKYAGIALLNGMTIPTLLDMATLERKIYNRTLRDSDLLDLMPYTGAGYETVTSVKLVCNVRKDSTLDVRRFEIDCVNIDIDKIDEYESNVSHAHAITLKLKNGVKGPFGEQNKIILDMKKAAFLDAYSHARAEMRNLDLTGHAHPRPPGNAL